MQDINKKNFIVVNSLKDNVAVCTHELAAGTQISIDEDRFAIKASLTKGQRFAIRNIAEEEEVIQYGYPFGISKGIDQGEIIQVENIREITMDLRVDLIPSPPTTEYSAKYLDKCFKGFVRQDGGVGTRNYYLIVPTSLCASQVVLQIASQAEKRYQPEKNYTNVDGIIAIPNTEGCGCAANVQIERFLNVLKNYITHSNVGKVLIVDLGCEQTNYSALHGYLARHRVEREHSLDWLTIQSEGGVQATITKAMTIIGKQLPDLNQHQRTDCALANLIVGTECGGSDAFSGITANPVIGHAIDKVIAGKGSAILSEFPEMVGTEHLLMQRMGDQDVIAKFKKMMLWYMDFAALLGVNMSDNLVPENISGGLINTAIKSLGAITKGGTSAIAGILDYGEVIHKTGLSLMQGPGNDMESVTGMVASGANMICFSTGKGTITGNAIVPVIKVASNSSVFKHMHDDMDFNAGEILISNNSNSLMQFGDKLLELILAVASGEKTKSEINAQRQFQVWTAGKLSL